MLKRRNFLKATLVLAGAAVAPSACTEEPVIERPLEDGSKYFPQSVASGDPKPDSVILWARVEDADAPGDYSLELEVATDDQFASKVTLSGAAATLTALADHDGCVKVKAKGLSAATVYYYRFIYVKGDVGYTSRTGRTKTAPAKDSDVPVKFAYVSCQDYIGRFYSAHVSIAQLDLDFVVHLGDYVYETTGDPSFQNTTGRKVTFTDEAGAIALMGGTGETYYAAKSLSNYRELYKTYRADKALQAVHEKFPMIVTWDDHEFSDDSHGATASYYDGKQDETDEGRRKAANQAWFEFQPVDYKDAEDFVYDPAAEYGKDITIYRDLQFGKNVHLVVTDLRSYRADHLIPEGAIPGVVVADQAALTTELGMVPADAKPYVDIDAAAYAAQKAAVGAAVTAGGGDAAGVTGNFGVPYVNAVVTAVNMQNPGNPPIPLIDPATPGLEKGYSYFEIGKTGLFSSIGARYLVYKDTFDVVGSIAYKAAPASRDVMGADQEAWFLSTMTGSTATWKVWANEYALNQLAIDLTQQMLAPPAFQKRFYMNVDQWDGFREKRSELIDALAAVGGVVAITGDIHAFYAGTPTVNGDVSKRIVEVVGSSVSSATFIELLLAQIAADPNLSKIPETKILAQNIDALLLDATVAPNPNLGFAKSNVNGFVLVEASSSEMILTTYQIGTLAIQDDYYDDPATIDTFTAKTRFRVLPGENDLYQDFDGTWKKWDQTTLMWV